MSDHKRTFIKLFNEIQRHGNRYSVFRDFVTMSAIAIQNALLKSQTLEQEYLDIVKRYKKEDAVRMSHLFAEVVMGLESGKQDFLGSLFMSLELGSDHIGQIFTPYPVCQLMAKMTHGDSISAMGNKPFITLAEPTCGAGTMIIAFIDAMQEAGINYQQRLWVSAWDIDPVAAYMCYIQLSLLHVPAEVVIGNSLSLVSQRVLRTPAHYMGLWDIKLRKRHAETEAISLVVDNEPAKVIIPEREAIAQPIAVPTQLSFFDFA